MKKNKAYILLVEDDKNLGFIIKDFLCESDYKVELAENGITALSLFTQMNFDLCLIDVMLPLKETKNLIQANLKKRKASKC